MRDNDVKAVNICPACGEPEDSDSYCPRVRTKYDSALAEFDDDDLARAIADEWDWFHRHPQADRWTLL